ncbi:hypothetical protein RDI58_017703 [Solanum bulbocastanum]|uniref:Uncharacterized protein n=1 Tax=Solanum bulbocastanum TaxID=147425 RepID=A0AAN8TCT7_SOLBU
MQNLSFHQLVRSISTGLKLEVVFNIAMSESNTPKRVTREYLSEGEGISVQYLDSKLHRIRHGALLWEYPTKKMEEGAVSENKAPPRMIRPLARIDNSQLVRID